MTSRISILSFLILFSSSSLFSQNDQVLSETNSQELLRLSSEWKKKREADMIIARQKAEEFGLELRQELSDGSIIEVQGLDELGNLLYYITHNKEGARTISTDDVWPGGSAGLSLNGSGMKAGEWDGGAVLGSHQELFNRVTQVDSSTAYADHATHVAGTIIGTGVDTAAKGMAYAANLDAYDWTNDDSEMAAAAANGLLISNHSYGNASGWRSSGSIMQWWGDTTISASEDYKFGFYNFQSQAWDQIARNAPYYLIVKSAGNDRGDSYSGQQHYLPLHGVFSSTARPDDGGTSGYDCISTYSGAKNILTVGAVNGISAGYSGPSSVVMSSFSGWGPTDDGRIKPDIVTKGVAVKSCLADSNNAYATWNGTSMATPGATGALLLLQEHYYDTYSAYMKAATLKALAIHTADEAGPSAGPDYMFGWGLMNTAKAALHISDSTGTKGITETSVSNGSSYSTSITVNGFSPIRATIAWTDVPGTPVSASLDPSNAMLVNDLDVRIIRDSDSTIYYPYILNPQSPASAASTGDNQRDNVEQIYIATPASGSYTIIVSHKGTLSGGSSQDFSLILDGGIGQAQPLNCIGIIQTPASWDFDTLVNCSTTSGSACAIPGSVGWTNDTSDDIDWTIDNGTTSSSSTGPSVDYTTGTTTGKFLYTEASTSGTGFPNKTAILNSACINLDTMNNTELFFAYHMYGSTMGTLSVEAYNGFAWTQVWTLSGNQGDVWNTAQVDLSLYDGDTIQLRFVGKTGSNYFSDMAIDGIQIREAVSCPGPINFAVSNITDTTAVVGWNSSASFHRIHLKIKDSITVIAPVTINFNPVLFTGLVPNTTYELYVQDSCGLNDTSLWIGPIEFTTSGPIQNPTPCGMGASIPDDNCPILSYLPFQVSTFGSQLGVDVQLREVRVIIEHTWVADLTFSIASPAGDTVLLSAHNGSSGDNYGDPSDASCLSPTRFTMTGDSLVTAGSAPYIGTYIPEESFSIINNGSNPNGIWKFIICDNASSDAGTLEHLELVFDTVATQSNCLFQSLSVSNDGIDSICAGDTASLYPVTNPSFVGNLTYQWYRNGQLLSGETSFFHESFLTGSYNVMLTDSNNCSDSASMGQWLEVLPLPVVSISNLGNDTLCPGDSTILICDTIGNYNWMKNGSFMSPPQIGQFITIKDSGNYNVLFTDQFYCWDTAAVAYSIEQGIDPVVQLSLIGDTTFCIGESSVLKATGAQRYQWYRNGIALSGMTDDSLVVSQEGRYNAYGYSTSNCGDSAISGISIFTNSLPVVVIANSGNSAFCLGDSTELSTTSGSSYQWYKNGVPLGGSIGSILVVNTSGDYNVLVTDSNLCADSASSATMIAVNNLPNVAITNMGSAIICDGDTATLTVPTGNNYQWYKNGLPINGATNYYYGVMDSGSYNVLVTDSNMCSDSAALATIIGLNPKPIVNINSSSQPLFCQGDSVTLSTISGTSYQWWKDGAIIPGPSATNQNYVATDSGLYNVRVSNSFNCWDSASTPYLVVVNKLPLVDISVIGDSVFCEGDSATLSTTAGLQYQWYQGSTLLPGQTQNTVIVRNSGTFNVLVTDMNNCSDSSRTPKVIMTNSLPLVVLSSNATSICEGDSATITAPIGFAYQWRKNGQSMPGENARFLYVKQSGTYNVVATNINFCADTASIPVSITVNDLPQVSMGTLSEVCNTTPKILLSGGLPLGGVYSGTGVSGVSGQYFFDPSFAGVGSHNIKYTFTNSNNCSNLDSTLQLVRNCVGIADQEVRGEVEFYPNPSKGDLYISVSDELQGAAQVRVFDVKGQIVASKSIEKVENNKIIEVNLNGLSDGVYFVHLRLGSEIFKQKIILEKN